MTHGRGDAKRRAKAGIAKHGGGMRDTALCRRVAAAVRKFYRTQHPKVTIRSIRHVYPRAYIVAKPAPLCIVVVVPWADAEPHMLEWERKHGAVSLHGDFDVSLMLGDWCSCAYVSHETGGGPVAVRVVP